MVRALAHHLGDEPDRFVDVTGDEQLTGHALVGTFDPPMVLKAGYQPEHFVPGPLARAMQAGGILYLEEMNRAPAGALNVLMTALTERYLEARFGGTPFTERQAEEYRQRVRALRDGERKLSLAA